MYHPTSRALTVLELLQSRPAISGPELADKLEMDVRTVRRYINTLQDAGIPIEGNIGRYGGYKLLPGYKIPPLMFNEEEATAAVLGLLGSSWLDIGLSSSAVESALSKISRVLPQTARKRLEVLSQNLMLTPHSQERLPEASTLLDLGEFISERVVLRIEYLSAGGTLSERAVEPYGLVAWKGNWYMVAFCRVRNDFRSFRLDRLQTWNSLGERFEKNESFDCKAFVSARPEWKSEPIKLSIEFKLPLDEIKRLVSTEYGEVTALEAGGTLFEYECDDLDYAARYLVALNIGFRIRGPEQFKKAMRDLVANLAASIED